MALDGKGEAMEGGREGVLTLSALGGSEGEALEKSISSMRKGAESVFV